ncbi:tail fiber domain-containing protein, partial [Flavobacterium chilense]|uniref:tail fiber domain-containing protein n=1 Tax=Flavobacterium chilense TaxID=946677 RepID=UPI000A691F26
GIILTTQLPSYVDDVLEFTNLAGFPATGQTGKIYIAKDTNKTYRWSGTAYVFITSGAVDSVAGKTGVVTLTKTDVGLSNVDNTTDVTKNVLSATKLTNPRTINGVSFDGSTNITITDTGKENSISSGTPVQYWRGDKTWQALNTANVPESGNLYFSNARAIASTLTGYASAAGTISASDTVLSAISKLNGNDTLKAPVASPIFTGIVTAPAFVGNLTGNSTGFPFQQGIQLDNLSGSISTIAREESPSSGYSYTSTLHMASGDGRQQLTISRDGSGMKFRGNNTGSGTTGWTSWKTVLTDINYTAYSAFSGEITGASLTVTGDVTAFSDERVKKNIRPISNAIERIKASRGVVYDRIDNEQKDNIGFIAQELEENFPELVLTREDGTKAVKYQNAVAVLFEAIKEQQTQIEQQRLINKKQSEEIKIILKKIK